MVEINSSCHLSKAGLVIGSRHLKTSSSNQPAFKYEGEMSSEQMRLALSDTSVTGVLDKRRWRRYGLMLGPMNENSTKLKK